MNLTDYAKLPMEDRCKSCQARLPTVISYYEHEGGWNVDGFGGKKQWLYKVCPKCESEWALWKLGVPKQ
jgi:hypothetical protein